MIDNEFNVDRIVLAPMKMDGFKIVRIEHNFELPLFLPKEVDTLSKHRHSSEK